MESMSLNDLPIRQILLGNENHEKIMDVFDDFHIDKELCKYPYHLLVYLQAEQNLLLTAVHGHDDLAKHAAYNPFYKDLLIELTDVNYNIILFLTTLFGRMEINPIQKLHSIENFEPIPEIDEILQSTYGYCVYAHQLEQLFCMLTGCSQLESIEFRKRWNKKDPCIRMESRILDINKSWTLEKFLEERTIESNQFVFTAKHHGAYHLWRYMQKCKIQK